jgi:hypothetical protein
MPQVISGGPVGTEGGNSASSVSTGGGDTGSGGSGGGSTGGSRGTKKDFSNLLLSDPGYPVPTPPARTMQAPKFSKLATEFFAALTTYPDVLNPAGAAAVKSAREAQASARAAIQTAGATNAWVSGQNYSKNESAISQIDFQSYRRTANGSGTLDPSLDKANWVPINNLPNGLIAAAFSAYGG